MPVSALTVPCIQTLGIKYSKLSSASQPPIRFEGGRHPNRATSGNIGFCTLALLIACAAAAIFGWLTAGKGKSSRNDDDLLPGFGGDFDAGGDCGDCGG